MKTNLTANQMIIGGDQVKGRLIFNNSETLKEKKTQNSTQVVIQCVVASVHIRIIHYDNTVINRI